MARRLSGGLVGQPSVGAINVAPTAVVTAAENQDITLSPTGAGSVVITNNILLHSQNDLRFGDADSSNWVAFQAPSIVGTNLTWTLPAVDGANDQVLTTNGSGILSWTTKSVGIVDNTTDSSTNFILFNSISSGNPTQLRVASSRLTFQPSTGTLTVTNIVESSSIALKENLTPIENALEKILNLQGYIYDRRDGSRKNEPGLIAEYVDPIIPEIVTKNSSGKPESIAYQRLVAYLIESIKQLNLEINQLKDKR